MNSRQCRKFYTSVILLTMLTHSLLCVSGQRFFWRSQPGASPNRKKASAATSESRATRNATPASSGLRTRTRAATKTANSGPTRSARTKTRRAVSVRKNFLPNSFSYSSRNVLKAFYLNVGTSATYTLRNQFSVIQIICMVFKKCKQVDRTSTRRKRFSEKKKFFAVKQTTGLALSYLHLFYRSLPQIAGLWGPLRGLLNPCFGH